MMATFAALESPSLLELPRKEVIFCRSSTLSTIQRNVEKAVNAKMPLLLQRASSHDKEIPAGFIHRQSRWVNRAFVRVSCPSIPGTLLESELFGYEKGTFNGACCAKSDRVELAHGGTLFLREIGDLRAESLPRNCAEPERDLN
jgi:two-component system response regulator AtoC